MNDRRSIYNFTFIHPSISASIHAVIIHFSSRHSSIYQDTNNSKHDLDRLTFTYAFLRRKATTSTCYIVLQSIITSGSPRNVEVSIELKFLRNPETNQDNNNWQHIFWIIVPRLDQLKRKKKRLLKASTVNQWKPVFPISNTGLAVKTFGSTWML